jgi:8-oxo-dGTP pyrophosphatase MutT (NUDIX family)
VLLVKRSPNARFMGGAWVFPGGAVELDEGTGQASHRAAAVRELAEETGIDVGDPGALVPYARWITPAEVKTRYDTWFYLARAPDGAEPRVDAAEIVAAQWTTPQAALAARRAGEMFLVFPTIRQLEQIAAFASAEALIEHARDREIIPVQPRIVGSGETARIVLPGDPEYAV